MTRVIPQMQVFFVAQPLVIGLGILMVASIIPVYVYFIRNLLEGYENNMVMFIKAMSH
jgi:flagellar biosynthetic protein FliR